MFGIKHRDLPAVIMHCGKTAYHNVENIIPCFYVIVPKGKHIDCHGGETFGDDEPEYHVPGFDHIEVPEGYCVRGWDYAHWDDYSGYFETAFPLSFGGKKWTTAEILENVKSVIKQLKAME